MLPYVFALAMMLTIPGRINAQCSGAPTLPTGCTWTPASGSVSIPGSGVCPLCCYITVNYCTSCCNGKVYCYVYGIEPTGLGGYCDAVSPQSMIYWCAAYARNQAVLGVHVQPCPTGTVVSTYVPSCWTEASFSGEYEITPCSDASCYCEDDCTVCINSGVPSYSGCTRTPIGICDCTALPNQSPWILGTCYTIPCDPLPGDH